MNEIAVAHDFDPGPGEAWLTPPQPNDLFLARYNSDGSYGWARLVSTGGDWDSANGLAVDNSGHVYMTGSFQHWAHFDPDTTIGSFDGNNYSTGFTVKYGTDLSTPVPSLPVLAPGLTIYPNPAKDQVTIRLDRSIRTAMISVHDAQGRLLAQERYNSTDLVLSVAGWPAGVYGIIARTPLGTVGSRLMVR